MTIRIRAPQLKMDIANLTLVLCCIFTCITGHEAAGTIVALSKYLVFGLLVMAVIRKGISINREVAFFCIANLFAAVVTALYHSFAGNSYFLLIPSVTAVLFYCLFAYCGYFLARERWQSEMLFRWIHGISAAAGLIVVMQYVCYLLGIHLNEIPVLGEYVFHAVDTDKYFRPSAFFSEPSHMAEVVLLDLYSNLFRRQNMRRAVLNMVCLVLSTSALGIVLGYGLIVWWALSGRIVKNKLINMLIKLMMVALMIAVLFAVLGYSGDSAILNRILKGATITQRTLRAFEIYGKLKPAEQIIGIGMQNLTSYLNHNPIYLVYDVAETQQNREYAQSFGYMLCTLGILGGGTYVWNIASLIKKTGRKYCGIVLLFAGLSVTSNLITRMIFVLYIAAMWTVVFERDAMENKTRQSLEESNVRECQ